MDISLPYVSLTVGALLIILILVFIVKRGKPAEKLTPLASLAFGFILAGFLFGAVKLIGYTFLLTGVIIAVVDVTRKRRD